MSLLGQMDPDRTSQHRDDGPPLSDDEFREGLDSDALRVVYQPKVAVIDRSVVGAEALARWEHPERGQLGPRAFLPVATRLNMMDIIDPFYADLRGKVVIPNSGHWVQQEEPEAVNEQLLAFLAGLNSAES